MNEENYTMAQLLDLHVLDAIRVLLARYNAVNGTEVALVNEPPPSP